MRLGNRGQQIGEYVVMVGVVAAALVSTQLAVANRVAKKLADMNRAVLGTATPVDDADNTSTSQSRDTVRQRGSPTDIRTTVNPVSTGSSSAGFVMAEAYGPYVFKTYSFKHEPTKLRILDLLAGEEDVSLEKMEELADGTVVGWVKTKSGMKVIAYKVRGHLGSLRRQESWVGILDTAIIDEAGHVKTGEEIVFLSPTESVQKGQIVEFLSPEGGAEAAWTWLVALDQEAEMVQKDPTYLSPLSGLSLGELTMLRAEIKEAKNALIDATHFNDPLSAETRALLADSAPRPKTWNSKEQLKAALDSLPHHEQVEALAESLEKIDRRLAKIDDNRVPSRLELEPEKLPESLAELNPSEFDVLDPLANLAMYKTHGIEILREGPPESDQQEGQDGRLKLEDVSEQTGRVILTPLAQFADAETGEVIGEPIYDDRGLAGFDSDGDGKLDQRVRYFLNGLGEPIAAAVEGPGSDGKERATWIQLRVFTVAKEHKREAEVILDGMKKSGQLGFDTSQENLEIVEKALKKRGIDIQKEEGPSYEHQAWVSVSFDHDLKADAWVAKTAEGTLEMRVDANGNHELDLTDYVVVSEPEAPSGPTRVRLADLMQTLEDGGKVLDPRGEATDWDGDAVPDVWHFTTDGQVPPHKAVWKVQALEAFLVKTDRAEEMVEELGMDPQMARRVEQLQREGGPTEGGRVVLEGLEGVVKRAMAEPAEVGVLKDDGLTAGTIAATQHHPDDFKDVDIVIQYNKEAAAAADGAQRLPTQSQQLNIDQYLRDQVKP